MNIPMEKTHYRWDDPCTIPLLEKAFDNNQVVISSTDTVLGLLAPLTEPAFEALHGIKGRLDKPYIVLLGSTRLVSLYCKTPLYPCVEQLMQACWPGPLTLILPAASTIDPFLQSGGKIAIRIPDHPGLLALLQKTKGAFSTSANLTGDSVAQSIDQLNPVIVKKTALLIYDTEQQQGVASTIIDCTKNR